MKTSSKRDKELSIFQSLNTREENPAEELSVSDVKDKLKSLGVKTWLRNEQKLRELLKKRIEKSDGSN